MPILPAGLAVATVSPIHHTVFIRTRLQWDRPQGQQKPPKPLSQTEGPATGSPAVGAGMGQELVGLLVELGERGADGGLGKTGTAGRADGGASGAGVEGPGGPIAGQGAAWGWGSKGRCGSGVD
jgi:hypothetical protein